MNIYLRNNYSFISVDISALVKSVISVNVNICPNIKHFMLFRDYFDTIINKIQTADLCLVICQIID